ncbi:hypothetical protein HX137_31255 [Pseudomonas sp. 165]|uniref:Uncharacterized protein n=1 Tax=Pseudomonas juntendi TaxID=2666183 RepID=A0AAJ5S5E6_9PSED|nr:MULTISPECIES: hypothetical protein [Pseudomonas]MDM1715101.1 hypothetical protein [Pseudomonas sp. 165]WEA23199.1 hypothetical protein PWA60_27310 [Pseudomonas juntendi]
MKVQWSPEDLKKLEQSVPTLGIQGAARRTRHSLRETYLQAIAAGIYMPPNGTGPWPRRNSKGAAWPAADERILRQEYTGPDSLAYISSLLERSPNDVEAMTITLGLAQHQGTHQPAPPQARKVQGPALTPLPAIRVTSVRAQARPTKTVADTVTAKAAPKAAEQVSKTSDEPFENSESATATLLTDSASRFEQKAGSLHLTSIEEILAPPPIQRATWTRSKDAYLKKHYHIKSVAEIAEAVGMTYYQTTSRARRLKISNTLSSWSREETIFLLEHIQTDPLTWVAEQLGRTMSAVSLRPKQLGIFPGWSGHDDQVLLQNIDTLTHAEIGKLINRPAYAVGKRLRFLTDHDFEFSRLGLIRLFEAKGREWVDGLIYLPVRPAEVGKTKWTEKQIAYLQKHYPTKGSIYCAAKLAMSPERVRHKAQTMGIKKTTVARPWTAEEDKWLLENVLKLDRMECARHLKRTKGAVSVRASVLGAFKNGDELQQIT